MYELGDMQRSKSKGGTRKRQRGGSRRGPEKLKRGGGSKARDIKSSAKSPRASRQCPVLTGGSAASARNAAAAASASMGGSAAIAKTAAAAASASMGGSAGTARSVAEAASASMGDGAVDARNVSFTWSPSRRQQSRSARGRKNHTSGRPRCKHAWLSGREVVSVSVDVWCLKRTKRVRSLPPRRHHSAQLRRARS